jgi:hypothetical protein
MPWGHYALGFTLASQGLLKPARGHLEQSTAFYDARKGGTYGFVQDPGPTALAALSHVVHALGYPDQGLKRMQQAVRLARNLSHPFTLAWVLGSAGELNWRRGEKLTAQGAIAQPNYRRALKVPRTRDKGPPPPWCPPRPGSQALL